MPDPLRLITGGGAPLPPSVPGLSAAPGFVVLTAAELSAVVEEATARGVVEGLRRGEAERERGRFLTAEQVGAMLGVAPKTVRGYVASDGLPCHRPGGRTPLFLADEVEAWLRDQP